MSHSRKKVNAKPLDTKAIRVAGDDIYVGGVRFKRTVLPSATAPSPQPIEAEADQLRMMSGRRSKTSDTTAAYEVVRSGYLLPKEQTIETPGRPQEIKDEPGE